MALRFLADHCISNTIVQALRHATHIEGDGSGAPLAGRLSREVLTGRGEYFLDEQSVHTALRSLIQVAKGIHATKGSLRRTR
jgi:hypothetical protein